MVDTPSLGSLLRDWRRIRGTSQLGLSLSSGISQRHLSFVESGRSSPTRGTLMTIADALDVPLRDRNALLLAAGYAPIYADDGWNAPQMERIVAAAKRLLAQQEPYPALLMDRYWNVLATNAASPRFFGQFVDLSAFPEARNILHMMFDPTALRPFIRDWDRVSRSLLERVRREAVGHALDTKGLELIAALEAYPGIPTNTMRCVPRNDLPMLPISFAKDGAVLSYFSMVATVGAPNTIAAQELRIECMFPADEATEQRHLSFVSDPKSRRFDQD